MPASALARNQAIPGAEPGQGLGIPRGVIAELPDKAIGPYARARYVSRYVNRAQAIMWAENPIRDRNAFRSQFLVPTLSLVS